jgi:regulator of protease activity HflC (stomatin/prohibitin superfamily)
MEALILVILLVILTGEIVAVCIKIPSIKITLGDLGDPYVRVPQNTALAILKHKKLIKIIFAVPQEKLKEYKERFPNKREDIEHIFISDAKRGGLYWIGFSFLGYEVYEWFETPEDERNGINALHSIDLAEQVIKYLPQESKKKKEGDKIVAVEGSEFDAIYGVPAFKSADNIEIRTSLAIFFVVKNPEKALFNIRYRKKAIREQIFPLWRDVMGRFSFFVYEEIESKKGEKKIPSQINPNIRTESNNYLRQTFGLLEKEVEKDGVKTKARDPEGIATKLFENEWGAWIRDITVGELEAADPEMEIALTEQMKARTGALAVIETAKGQKTAFELEGAGKEELIKSIVRAFTADGKTTSEAIRAAVQWRQFEALEKMPKEGKYIYQWPQISAPIDPIEELLKKFDVQTLQKIIQKFELTK